MIDDLLEDNSLDHQALVLAETRQKFEQALANNPWGLSPKALEAKRAATALIGTKTGMYAKIPLVCKADDCPYAQSCALIPYGLAPLGEYCPVEIAQIESLAQGYTDDIDYDELSFTDRSLINELVCLDIMLERCRGLMAKEQTPVIEVVIGVSENGREIKQPAVSKALEAYDKLSKQKAQKLQLLHLTRTDKIRHAPEEDKKESWIQTITQNITAEDLAAVKEG